jgi:hypothetical protein
MSQQQASGCSKSGDEFFGGDSGLPEYLLFEKQLRGLTQVFNGLGNGFALGRGSSFGVEGNIASFFGRCEHSSQLHAVNVPDEPD